MTKVIQKIDKQITSLLGKIDNLSGEYLTNTWKRQREQQERDRKKELYRTQLQVMEYLKQKANDSTLSLLEQNLAVSAFYEDMRCFSVSKKYCADHKYIEFQYPKPNDVRVKRLQKAGITNTQELIAAVEQYDNLVRLTEMSASIILTKIYEQQKAFRTEGFLLFIQILNSLY